MNFSGYVPLRRGILDHLMSGDLTIHEYAAFSVLLMLADKETGSWKINARALMYWLPDLEYDAAKRVLQHLEEKRYIYREIVPFSKNVYPYWVHRYVPSTGPHKLLQIDLTKVFDSKDIKDIQYTNPALDDARDLARDPARDPALKYKKGEGEGRREKETPNNPDGRVDGWTGREPSGERSPVEPRPEITPAEVEEIPAASKARTTTPYVPTPPKPHRMGGSGKRCPSATTKAGLAPAQQIKSTPEIPVDSPEGRLSAIFLGELLNPVPHRESAASTWLPLVRDILAKYPDEQELTQVIPWAFSPACWYADKFDDGPKPMEFFSRNIDGIVTSFRKAHKPAPSVIKSTTSTVPSTVPAWMTNNEKF